MTDEATKTNRLRSDDFKNRYFSGRVIDIGCGQDLVVPHAVPFDVEHGDAQWVSDHFGLESFDCVHSSHCLEHMNDVKVAICNWWSLVKPGGYLIVVVPDEDLYEQGHWPSLFNPDHKATFTIGKSQSWSPVSYDIKALVEALPGVEIIEASLQDNGYDRRLLRKSRTAALALHRWGKGRQRFLGRLTHVGVPVWRLTLALDRLEYKLGKPIDQTDGPAMAQIQVVARKSNVGIRH